MYSCSVSERVGAELSGAARSGDTPTGRRAAAGRRRRRSLGAPSPPLPPPASRTYFISVLYSRTREARPALDLRQPRVIQNALNDLVLGIIFCFEFDSILKL